MTKPTEDYDNAPFITPSIRSWSVLAYVLDMKFVSINGYCRVTSCRYGQCSARCRCSMLPGYCIKRLHVLSHGSCLSGQFHVEFGEHMYRTRTATDHGRRSRNTVVTDDVKMLRIEQTFPNYFGRQLNLEKQSPRNTLVRRL